MSASVQSNGNTRASHLRDLDYSVVQQCMHCGLCLPTCPTYDATKLERNSPRGRISLMRAIADGRLEPSKAFADEIYFCLGCLACMTACPAGVNYAELFEHARAEAEQTGTLNNPKRSLIRAVTLRWLFYDIGRLQLLGSAIRLYQQTGVQSFVRNSGVMNLFPKRMRELEAMTPTIQPQFSSEMIAPLTPARGDKKYRVAVLTGCAQDIMFSNVNRDTVEVLSRNGCEVVTPAQQNCCGSLHAHNGELEMARELARRNIDQFPPDKFDAIITNAAGCGSHLKHYSNLLAHDAQYAQRAKQWDSKLKDIHEWLAKSGIQTPPQREPQTVTYHEACHLCHGQKITAQPRQVLKSIPNLKLVELPESNWCCGSAGIYNLIQPEMANQLLDRKLGHVKKTNAPIVASANPGCLAHMFNGVRRHNMSVRLVHPITLLAEAYRGE
jgi:glycolate oxidase iron-sulfur subunit